MKTANLWTPSLAFVTGLVLSACGGGGGDASPGESLAAAPHFRVQPWPESGSGTEKIAANPWLGTGVRSTLSPADIRARYNMPAQYSGAGQTIAIVDAPGTGNVASDLNAFSTYYGLPQCNSTNPCLQITDLSKGRAVSRRDDWGTEIALDVQWAHAVAPGAKIVLVIAASSSMADMMGAVRTAAAIPNVTAVSMSWGSGEFGSQTTGSYDGLFSANTGIVFLASSGDSGNNGGNQSYPAASPWVTAVGGSTIKSLGTPTTANEVAWVYSGGGPSQYETMPTYQRSFLSSSSVSLNSGKRAIPDVAYNADPSASPVAIYMGGSWTAIGGTSAGAPQWAGIMALFGQYLQVRYGTSLATLVRGSGGFNSLIYQTKLMQSGRSSFYDVTSGSNNTSRRNCVLCSASAGYDDVTGLGVPNVGTLLGYF